MITSSQVQPQQWGKVTMNGDGCGNDDDVLATFITQLFPMSMLACLGSDAESIRDIYLMRLHALTEVNSPNYCVCF